MRNDGATARSIPVRNHRSAYAGSSTDRSIQRSELYGEHAVERIEPNSLVRRWHYRQFQRQLHGAAMAASQSTVAADHYDQLLQAAHSVRCNGAIGSNRSHRGRSESNDDQSFMVAFDR